MNQYDKIPIDNSYPRLARIVFSALVVLSAIALYLL